MNRSHVMAAIKEHDRLGSKEFLQRYGFRRRMSHALWQGGQEYDATAILGVASFFATGTPPSRDDFTGEAGVATVLMGLGFDVVVTEDEVSPSRSRKATPKPQRQAAPSPSVKLCPRCHVAVPASGICDFCD